MPWWFGLAKDYILSRLAEGQTWQAISSGFLAEIGIHINPDVNTPLVHALTWLGVAIGVGIREGWTAKPKVEQRPVEHKEIQQ